MPSIPHCVRNCANAIRERPILEPFANSNAQNLTQRGIDEYERAADELKNALSGIDSHHFLAIVDPETSDPDCVSVERILNHVVNAGYGYANLIRKQFGDAFTEKIQAKPMQTAQDACLELDQMLHYTAETLENKM